MSFVVQFGGSLLIVLPKDGSRVPEFGCYVLLAWCMWHPFMYRQQTNWEFVLETCTIMGGLLVLLSAMQTSYHDARKADSVGKVLPVKTAAEGGGAPADATDSMLKAAQRNQAFGRVLITSVFIFYAFQKARHHPPPLTHTRTRAHACSRWLACLLAFASMSRLLLVLWTPVVLAVSGPC